MRRRGLDDGAPVQNILSINCSLPTSETLETSRSDYLYAVVKEQPAPTLAGTGKIFRIDHLKFQIFLGGREWIRTIDPALIKRML